MDLKKILKKITQKPPALSLEEEYPRLESGVKDPNSTKKYW